MPLSTAQLDELAVLLRLYSTDPDVGQLIQLTAVELERRVTHLATTRRAAGIALRGFDSHKCHDPYPGTQVGDGRVA